MGRPVNGDLKCRCGAKTYRQSTITGARRPARCEECDALTARCVCGGEWQGPSTEEWLARFSVPKDIDPNFPDAALVEKIDREFR